MLNAICMFNTWAKPFDWKGRNMESIPVVLRSRVATSFGVMRTETISAGVRICKTKKCARENRKVLRMPFLQIHRVGMATPGRESSQNGSMLSRVGKEECERERIAATGRAIQPLLKDL